jgi:hypothetical protein
MIQDLLSKHNRDLPHFTSRATSTYEHSENTRATQKRTEGRAPVWGSELTTKAAKIQGGQNNWCSTLL